MANRQKPSTIVTTAGIDRCHLEPAFGATRLDAIDDEVLQAFKGTLSARSPKTMNNVIPLLGKALRIAVEWERIDRLPCKLKLVKVRKTSVDLYDPSDHERLLEGAKKSDPRTTSSPCSAATPASASPR